LQSVYVLYGFGSRESQRADEKGNKFSHHIICGDYFAILLHRQIILRNGQRVEWFSGIKKMSPSRRVSENISCHRDRQRLDGLSRPAKRHQWTRRAVLPNRLSRFPVFQTTSATDLAWRLGLHGQSAWQQPPRVALRPFQRL